MNACGGGSMLAIRRKSRFPAKTCKSSIRCLDGCVESLNNAIYSASSCFYWYLLRSILIRTLVFLLALARCARVMPEPYQFRNAWPRRFERGNIRH